VRDALLASDPSTASAVLAVLATHPDAAVRRAVAGNPNAPQAVVLELMAQFPAEALANPLVELLVVAEPDLWAALPPRTQEALAGSRACPLAFVRWVERAKDSPHFSRLVFNLALPVEVRRRLFGLGRFRLDPRALPQHIGREWATLLVRAGYEAAPPDPTLTEAELQRLSTLGPLGCTVAAGHPRCSPALVAAVALGQVGLSTGGAARNPQLPEEAMPPILQGRDGEALLGLAENPRAPAGVLVALAGRAEVATALARRPRLPMEVVDALLVHAADAAGAELASMLAWQPDLSPGAQAALCAHPSLRVRMALAHRAQVSDATQAALAADPALAVRETLARWGARPPAMALLAADPSERVRLKLADWAPLPAALQAQLAQDASPRVRACLARNPAVLPEVQRALRADPDPWVRARARGLPDR
jgi:hypothetical protein